MKRLLLTIISLLLVCDLCICNPVESVKKQTVLFSCVGYAPKKLTCKHMDLMNAVFVEFPMGMIRLFKAAIAAKKLLDEVEGLTPIYTDEKTGKSIYFATEDEELAFIRNNIKGILDPIDKFLEEALQKSKTIVLTLFEKILGQDAKCGFLLPALNSNGKPSDYLVSNLQSVEELRGAVSEFYIFYSDINYNLSDEAKAAYQKKLESLKKAQQVQNTQCDKK